MMMKFINIIIATFLCFNILAWEKEVYQAVEGMEFDLIVNADSFEAEFERHNLPIQYINNKLVVRASIHGLWRAHPDAGLFRSNLAVDGDNHLLAVGGMNVLIENLYLINDLNLSEALKFSRAINIIVRNNILTGGKEDVVDIVQGINYTFLDNIMNVTGYRAMTIKGGVVRVDMINNHFFGTPKSDRSPGGKHYIDLGNWGELEVIKQRWTRGVRISETNHFEVTSNRTYPVRTMRAHRPLTDVNLYNMPNFMLHFFWGIQRIKHKKRVFDDPKYQDQLTWNSLFLAKDYPMYQKRSL